MDPSGATVKVNKGRFIGGLALALALPFAGLWAYKFFDILDYGDLVYPERVLIFALVVIHLMTWIVPIKRDFNPLKWLILALTCLGGLFGLFLGKPSIIALGFTPFIWSLGALFTPRRDARMPLMMVAAMSALLLPGWLFTLPSEWSLQEVAAKMSFYMLRLADPDFLHQGTMITVGGRTMSIAASCDGSSFLRLNVALAFYCSVYTKAWTKVAWRIVAAMALAIVLNWVRIFVLGLLLKAGYEDFAFRSGHALIGHITFACGVLPILWLSAIPDKWAEFISYLGKR